MRITLSSSFVLGVIVGISLLIFGEATLNLDLDLDFGTLDGLWVIFVLPMIAVLTFVILSPLSFLIYKRLSKRNDDGMRPDS